MHVLRCLNLHNQGSIQVLQAHFRLHVLRYLSSVCLQPGYIHIEITFISVCISVYRESTSNSPRAHSFISGRGNLGSCGTQPSQISDLRHPWTWDCRNSVISAHQVPWGLARLSPFSPPDTLGTGRTQSFQPPGILWNGRTQSFQPPRYPGDWPDSILSAPLMP